jgi:sensor domain CHASE-containing protein
VILRSAFFEDCRLWSFSVLEKDLLMSVRIRTLLIVGGVLLSLVLALIISAQLIVTRGFEQLEADQARDNIERVNNAVSEEIARLNSTNGDWAYWDDTYQFIEDANPDYIESNLAVETLVNLDVKSGAGNRLCTGH